MANVISTGSTMGDEWTDAAILEEVGTRIAQRRLGRQWRQADLAYQSGVSKRTVERIEAGVSVQAVLLLRVLRALGLLAGMNQLVPARGPSPMELLKLEERRRKRGRRGGGAGSQP